jgi:hypothetical protein
MILIGESIKFGAPMSGDNAYVVPNEFPDTGGREPLMFHIEGTAPNRHFCLHVRNQGPGVMRLGVQHLIAGNWVNTVAAAQALRLVGQAQGQLEFVIPSGVDYFRLVTYNLDRNGGTDLAHDRCDIDVRFKNMSMAPLGI